MEEDSYLSQGSQWTCFLLLEVEGILIGRPNLARSSSRIWLESNRSTKFSRKIVANPTRLCSTALDAILAHLN